LARSRLSLAMATSAISIIRHGISELFTSWFLIPYHKIGTFSIGGLEIVRTAYGA